MKSLKSLIFEVIKEPRIDPDEKWYCKFGDDQIETFYGPFPDYKSACLAGFLHQKPIGKDSPPKDRQKWDRSPAHFISQSTVSLNESTIRYIKEESANGRRERAIFLPDNKLKPHPDWNNYRKHNPKFPEEWFEELWKTQSY